MNKKKKLKGKKNGKEAQNGFIGNRFNNELEEESEVKFDENSNNYEDSSSNLDEGYSDLNIRKDNKKGKTENRSKGRKRNEKQKQK